MAEQSLFNVYRCSVQRCPRAGGCDAGKEPAGFPVAVGRRDVLGQSVLRPDQDRYCSFSRVAVESMVILVRWMSLAASR